MCFSAPASLIASGGLVVIGGASLAIAKKEEKILAAIPFLFGIQQAFEGIQWLHLNVGPPSLFAGYGFLFFAFLVWPVYVPAMVFVLDKKTRAVTKWFIFLGILVALALLAAILTQPLFIEKLQACISYSFHLPFEHLVVGGYLFAVLAPLLASSSRFFRWFGVVIVISAVVAWLFFSFAFTSVWCFFAAIISAMLFAHVLFEKRNMA